MSEMSPEGQYGEEDVLQAPTISVGERLRAAREALGLDAEAIAASLKLSKRQIEALETSDWAKLPGHTFVRGFVRNYARVVQLDADELLADLQAPLPVSPRLDLPQNTSAVMPETGRVQKRDYPTVLAGIVLVTIAVIAYYVVPPDFWQSRPHVTPPVVNAEPAPLFPPAGLSGTEAVAQVQAGVAMTPSSISEPVPAGVAPVSPVASGNGLKMRFSQPSWVEVRDRSGQIIFSQLNPAGSEHEVEGQPPFSLVVGNAGNVSVQYKGRNIELQPRSKDDVARVTVE